MDKFERGQRAEMEIYDDAWIHGDDGVEFIVPSPSSLHDKITAERHGKIMDKLKNVHPIFRRYIEDQYKDFPIEDLEFCYYGHIMRKPIEDPNDMMYWMPPDSWCESCCGVWNRELGQCGFIDE